MHDLSLDVIRRIGTRVLLAAICFLAAAIGGVWAGLAPTTDNAVAFGMALALCVYPAVIVARGRTDAEARMSLSITAVALPSLLLFAAKGMAWQTDIHMVFFAALAMTAILCDWKALVAATITVAVHHLVFGMLVPGWVFGSEASLARIVFHAVVLLAEAGALVWVAAQIVKLIGLVSVRERQQQAMQAAHDEERQARMKDLERTVGAFGHALDKMRRGDLTAEITGELAPGYTELRTNFNEALVELRMLIGSVMDSTAAIRNGSDDIVCSSQNLARRAEANAASLERTSTALTQIDGRLKTNAVAAEATVQRADQAIATVRGGRTIAEEVAQAMSHVSDTARGIDSVIEGVDKIAFQTRVLAMNAAVEAGRAGEAGRGFAVVADLVSGLAMRAEEEAKRAHHQLTATQAGIVTAVEAVQKVDSALADISADAVAVHQLLDSMAADNRTQSAAVTEISAAINAMGQTTQQDAAMVDQASTTARSLNSQVSALSQRAARFRVDGGVPGAAAPAIAERLAAPAR